MELITLPIGNHSAFAKGYIHSYFEAMPHRKARPCVVVCPGGGYQMVSDRENEPIASALFAAGYQVFALTYSVGELARDFIPLSELSMLVSHIRQNSQAYRVNPDQIAVMGFSAGGHLAASLGTLWGHPALLDHLSIPEGSNKPNGIILSYPVISAGAFAHTGSLDRVSGGDPTQRSFFSLETKVTKDTPPTFLWHTYEDTSVPVENSLLFIEALRKADVPFEAHIFPRGSHGLSLCNEEVGTPNQEASIWFPLCLAWLQGLFDFKA